MPLRGWIKRLERASREDLASFELLDGSRYYFDPTSPIFFMKLSCVQLAIPTVPPDLTTRNSSEATVS